MATCRCFLPGRAGLSQGLAGALLRGASLLHVLAAGGCIQIPAAPRSLLDGGALDGGAPGDTGVDGGRGWDGGSQDAGRPRQDAAVSDAGRPPDGATCPIVACPDDENSCTGPGVVTPDCRCDHPHIQEGEECDDHDRCTRRDRCRSGQCVGEDPLLCEGVASACREQRCDRATGDCMPTPIHDGEACPTGPECAAEPCRCAAGSCLPCQPSCTERRCGENGCGGSCGECGDAEECALPAGRCVPQGMAALAVAPGEGIFAMGSPPEEDGRNDADEQQHQVLLSPFLIDRLEVSQQQYQSCVDDAEARCPEPTGCRSGLLDWQPGLGPKAGKELLPVRCASWAMAEAYCRFAGERLCS
ncbi:MAG: hypothetical protein FJ125_18095, partial [Deltaproteobacteria bacterium]|nr:hypothetical protein [Deltaproteobacteria bacterium]